MPSQAALAVSPATDDDLEAIAALDRASFADPWGLDYFRQESQRDDRWLGTARQSGGAVLGFADCWFVCDEVQLQRIAVGVQGRRRGVGATLLGALLDLASARSLRVITLEVAADNQPAIALYRRFGFVEVGRRPHYYQDRIDALLLDRVLSFEP